ncbi:MAG: hypothetical protein ACK5KR_01990 [Breznakia sp.]
MKIFKAFPYQSILKLSFVFGCVLTFLLYIGTNRLDYALSAMLGMSLSVLGFMHIVFTSDAILHYRKPQVLSGGQFVIRFIFYGICFYTGARLGGNLICMLLGFLCLSTAIKVKTIRSKGV